MIEFYPTNNFKEYFVTSYYIPHKNEAVEGGVLYDMETIGNTIIKDTDISPQLLKSVNELEDRYIKFLNNEGCRFMRFDTVLGYMDILFNHPIRNNQVKFRFMDEEYKPLPYSENLTTFFLVFIEKIRNFDKLSEPIGETWVTWGELWGDSVLLLTTTKKE